MFYRIALVCFPVLVFLGLVLVFTAPQWTKILARVLEEAKASLKKGSDNLNRGSQDENKE